MIKIIYILSLIRIFNILIGMLAVYIATIIINPDISIINILMIMFQVGLVMALGNLINDIQDISTDKIAHPTRPLVTGKINFKEAKIMMILLFLLIGFISLSFSFKANLFLYIVILPLLFLYTNYLKPIPIIGNIIIAFLLSSIFIFTELCLLNSFSILQFPSILIFGLSFLRELLKDVQDYDGDATRGIYTLPVILGKKQTINIAIILIMAYAIIILVPYFLKYFDYIYLYSIIILVEIPLFIMVFLLLNKPTNKSFKYIAYLTKGMSLAGLFIILILYI